LKALAISEAGSYVATNARLRNSNAQRQTRRADLISDMLPFGRQWYDEPGAVSNAIGYAEHSRRSHDAVIRIYDAVGKMIEKHEHKGDLKELS
jgi:hypothetical protein